MAQRDDLFQQFGPILLEAACLLIRDEINLLRSLHGLPPRTNQQIFDEINNHLSTLTKYDWMENP